MKIVFISTLFPAYKDHFIVENYSMALLNIVRHWKGIDLKIIRPLYTPKNFLSEHGKGIKGGCADIDGIDIYNVPIFRFPKLRIYNLKKIFELFINLKFKPDVVIGHMGDCAHIAYKIASSAKIPYIVGVHYSDTRTMRYWYNQKYKKILENAAVIICRSQVIKRRLIDFGINGVFEVITSGVPTQMLKPWCYYTEKLDRIRKKKMY